MKLLILPVLLIILLLTLLSDYLFLKRLGVYFPARARKIFFWLCTFTHLYFIGYAAYLYCTPHHVVLPHLPTLVVIAFVLSKLLWLILWGLFIFPIAKLRPGSTQPFYAATSLSVILCSYLLISGIVTRSHLKINRVEITSDRLPQSFDGYRIVHISDLHTGTFISSDTLFLATMVESIRSLRPDIVCFTGDIVNRESQEIVPYLPILQRLYDRQHPVYCVLGNHDYADYSRRLSPEQRAADTDTLRHYLRSMNWILLDDTTHIVHHRSFHQADNPFNPSDQLALMGVGNIGEPPFSSYGNLEKPLAMRDSTVSSDCFSILLSHNPTHWREEVLTDGTIDLTLSGHTHGMQTSIFGFSPAAWIYDEWGGLYSENDRHLYVNVGVGAVGFPIRIGMRPEITLITLRSKKDGLEP